MKKLIIAEKPSVAKNIVDAFKIKSRRDGYFEGSEYIITWAFGHLLQLYDARDYDESMKFWRYEKFPFIPNEFKYKVKSDSYNKNIVDSGAKKQLSIIKSLIDRNDVEFIVSATDYDREGQVIFDELLLYFEINKPIYRLLLNEWTEDEVKKGMQNLKLNSEMQFLQDAGISRQLADWLIGINLTSVATLKYKTENKQIINIGRVLLPTLKIIYDRDKEIENFKSSSYYKLLAYFKGSSEFESLYYEKNSEKFDDKSYLDNINKLLNGKHGDVVSKEIEKKKEYPQPLFNLSNLQGYITNKYKGWTSDKVLKVAQSLYEKKLITYPRTASVVLEESLEGRCRKVLGILKKGLEYEEEVKFVKSKRVFDNSKVESHSAITPTYVIPKNLSVEERNVYDAIKNRFIMQFMPVCEFEETKVILKVNNENISGEFIAKGKVEIIKGWKKVEKVETKDTILPLVEKGDKLEIVSSKVSKVTKKPPKNHTEKTLLKVMETCGKKIKKEGSGEKENSEDMMNAILSGFSIGTPATRAETIKRLKDVGYINSKGKNLTSTDLGKKIVETFPAKELLNLEYTGRLEKTLSDIEKGKYKKEDFLNIIKGFVVKSVKSIKEDKSLGYNSKVEILKDSEIIGVCPQCKNNILENDKAFGCSNWRNGCKYTIWKNDRFINSLGKEVSIDMIKILLKNGKVGFRNLKSKNGTLFSAYLKYEKSEENEHFKWSLEFIDNTKN